MILTSGIASQHAQLDLCYGVCYNTTILNKEIGNVNQRQILEQGGDTRTGRVLGVDGGQVRQGLRALLGKRPDVAATRVAFILAHVEIPGDLLVLHTCDNPGCVNPDHLYAGTHKDNHLDMVTRNRAPTPNSMPGETNPGSKLTARGVKDIRKRYAAGGILQRQLAEEYGVAQTNISFIVRGEHWKHI